MRRKRRPDAKPRAEQPEVLGFLGIGLDSDGHRRLTHADHFLIVGGSAETHEKMQETAARFGEALDKAGRPLRELSPDEAADLLREARKND
jgi:hypothetical protein